MKTFIVLGMHRSATSLIAKGLALSGVHMGDRLLGAHSSNPYGHFEDVDFIQLNDKILFHAGGKWDKPPLEKNIIEVGLNKADKIKEFVERKKRSPFWGWKDPRTVLTIRCFLPYLDHPHFICCYRKANEVAGSLFRRDGMPISEGIQLAKIYNNRMAKFIAEWDN